MKIEVDADDLTIVLDEYRSASMEEGWPRSEAYKKLRQVLIAAASGWVKVPRC